MHKAIGVDLYNQDITGNVSKTLNAIKTDSDHVPCAVVFNSSLIKAYGFDQGATRDVGDLLLPELSKTLANGTCPGHHNGVIVVYETEEKENDDISEDIGVADGEQPSW